MELETSTWMMILFIVLFILSMWKIYAFLPSKSLADDDTTKESQEDLIKIIKKYNNEEIHPKELFKKVKNDEDFDSKHFWRFNQNKLNQILHTLE